MTTSGMEFLGDVIRDCRQYREILEKLFKLKLSSASHGRRYFQQLCLQASRLFVDYRRSELELPRLMAEHRRKSNGNVDRAEMASNFKRQVMLRRRLDARLKAMPCLAFFKPSSSFAGITGLHSLDDILRNFDIHLPEIHEESYRVEKCAINFRERFHSDWLIELEVSLQHMGGHHILFLLPALDLAAQSVSWV